MKNIDRFNNIVDDYKNVYKLLHGIDINVEYKNGWVYIGAPDSFSISKVRISKFESATEGLKKRLDNLQEKKLNPNKKPLTKAQEIILALDKYGRNVASVEYGLPVDPDHNDWEDRHTIKMQEIVNDILNN